MEQDGSSRRVILRALLGGSAAVAGGCMGDENDATEYDLTTAMPSDDRVSASWDVAAFDIMDTFQWNAWNDDDQVASVMDRIWGLLATFDSASRTLRDVYLADRSFDSDVYDLVLQDDWYWHDGEQVTAEDVETYWTLERYATADSEVLQDGEIRSTSGIWGFPVDHVLAVDDRTFRVRLDGPVNESLFEERLANVHLCSPTHVFDEWVARFEEAVDAGPDPDAYDRVRSEFLQWRWADDSTDVLGNTCWQVEDIVETRATLGVFGDDPYAENINYDSLRIFSTLDRQEQWSMLMAGEANEIEATYPADVRGRFPENVVVVDEIVPKYFGSGIAFNFEDPRFRHQEVRKAIALVLDNRPVTQVDRVPVTDNWSGIGGGFAGVPEETIGEEVLNSLENYDQDHERAAELLESVDYYREDDEWYTDGGDRFEFRLMVPSSSAESIQAFQLLGGQLVDFGIKADLQTVNPARYWDRRENGDFESCEEFWAHVNPYHWWDHIWGAETDPHGWWGIPHEVDVSEPFTSRGKETTIDAHALVRELETTSDAERQAELHSRLSWCFNQTIPFYPVEERLYSFTVNPNSDFIVPLPERPHGALDDPSAEASFEAFRGEIGHGLLNERGLIAASDT